MLARADISGRKISSDSRFLFKNFAVPVTWLQLGFDHSTAPYGFGRAGLAPALCASKITQVAY
jgi:hypothetical protein